jgi:hypothetical protein
LTAHSLSHTTTVLEHHHIGSEAVIFFAKLSQLSLFAEQLTIKSGKQGNQALAVLDNPAIIRPNATLPIANKSPNSSQSPP